MRRRRPWAALGGLLFVGLGVVALLAAASADVVSVPVALRPWIGGEVGGGWSDDGYDGAHDGRVEVGRGNGPTDDRGAPDGQTRGGVLGGWWDRLWDDDAGTGGGDRDDQGRVVPEEMPPPPGTVVLTPDGAIDVAATAAAAQHLDAGGMQPGLVAALADARAAAGERGITLPVSSGYRSAGEQAENLARELRERGDLQTALRWVFAPDRSMHVRGLAIDVNSGPAADWLHVHGRRFGLCKTLAWEWWHFEWREAWQRDAACPPPAQTPDGAPGP